MSLLNLLLMVTAERVKEIKIPGPKNNLSNAVINPLDIYNTVELISRDPITGDYNITPEYKKWLDVFKHNGYVYPDAWAHTVLADRAILMKEDGFGPYGAGEIVLGHEVAHNVFPEIHDEDMITKLGQYSEVRNKFALRKHY